MNTNGICAVFGAVGRHRVRVTAFAQGGGVPSCLILGCIDERVAGSVVSRMRDAAQGSGFSWPGEEVLVNVVPSAGPLVDGELERTGAVSLAADPFVPFRAANPDMIAVRRIGTAPDGVGLCGVEAVSSLSDLRTL